MESIEDIDKRINDEIKAKADKDCVFCEGTGFITKWGFGNGMVCGCVDRAEQAEKSA